MFLRTSRHKETLFFGAVAADKAARGSGRAIPVRSLPQSLDIKAIEFCCSASWKEFLQRLPVSLDLLFSVLDPAGPEMKRPTLSIRSDAGTAGGWASLTRRQNLGTLMLPRNKNIDKRGRFSFSFFINTRLWYLKIS